MHLFWLLSCIKAECLAIRRLKYLTLPHKNEHFCVYVSYSHISVCSSPFHPSGSGISILLVNDGSEALFRPFCNPILVALIISHPLAGSSVESLLCPAIDVFNLFSENVEWVHLILSSCGKDLPLHFLSI